MFEEIFKFITQNNPLISLVVVSGFGLFAVVKWYDLRNRELKEKRYSKYMELIGIISGNKVDGTTPRLTEQIAAVCFLQEYKEYHAITKRIFSDSDFTSMADKVWVKHVVPHINKLLKEI